jgi:hypothetical protein
MALNPTTSLVERVLFSIAGRIHETLVSDATGSHVLAVVSEPDDTSLHLYRWSDGLREPVRLPASYIAAAWAP